MKRNLIFSLILITGLVLSACGSVAQTLSEEEQAEVLAFTEPKTDTLLEGLTSGEYATFSAGFDADMLNALSEDKFTDLKAERDGTLGNYLSRQVSTITKQDGFYTVFYLAQFEKQADVIMRVVFREEEPHPISGLWFNK